MGMCSATIGPPPRSSLWLCMDCAVEAMLDLHAAVSESVSGLPGLGMRVEVVTQGAVFTSSNLCSRSPATLAQ